MAALSGTDTGDCLTAPLHTDLNEGDDSNPNSLLMCSPSDDPTADWIQWMRWDDVEDDKSSYPLDNINCKEPQQPQQQQQHQPQSQPPLLPSSDAYTGMDDQTHVPTPPDMFNMAPFDFSFDACMSPTHARSSSNGSVHNQSPLSPSIGDPSLLDIPQPSSSSLPVTFGSGQNQIFPPTPSSTSPVSRKRKCSDELTASAKNPSTTTATAGAAAAGASSQASPASGGKNLPSKKRSHNVIEKRYRANLNDKIAELRDSVPSLRIIYKQRHGGVSGQKEEDEEDYAVSSSNKLNKASILSKATEYIKHLEVRNNRLEEENIGLKNRLRQLEKVQDRGLMAFTSVSGSESSPGACTISTDISSPPDIFSHTGEFSPESTPNPLYPPEGLIKVPEYFKRMRPTGPQPHYAEPLQYQQQQQQQQAYNNSPQPGNGGGGARFSGFPNKFMLGTLAGLMIIGGFETHKKPESEKELLAVPLQYLGTLYGFVQKHSHIIRVTSWKIRALFQFAMTSIFVVACAFFVFLYLFYSRPRAPRGPSKQQSAHSVTTGMSSTEIRRNAWLTSIQTVGVPRHNFFPEWFAVTSRCFEYCLRCLLGWRLYSFITGISEDDEKGRVKAWDIALDAQLTGGDTEVSKSRLVLTIFAAGTLPQNPARMMLKAFHCRVLLWKVGDTGSLPFRISNFVADILASYQWNLAQEMHKKLPKDHEDTLPSHLAYLLTMDSEKVFTDAIIQRSLNMIWNRPTHEATDGDDSLLDVVVEDPAVRSPLDVLAAWWSSRGLQETLLSSIDLVSVENASQKRKAFESNLDSALNSAPATSTAYTRASVIKALFCNNSRVKNINSVLAALPSPKQQASKNAINFLDSSVPISARGEISISVRCAMIAAILGGQVGKGSAEPADSPFSIPHAIKLFNKLPIDEVELTLLGFAALYHLLHLTATDERLFPCASLSSSFCSSSSESLTAKAEEDENGVGNNSLPLPDLARIAADLIYWVRNAYNPISAGVDGSLTEKVVEDIVDLCRNAGIHIDVKKIQQIKTHQRQPSVTFSESVKDDSSDESVDADNVSNGGDDAKSERTRRGSTKSNDTGYGSLSCEEASETKNSPTCTVLDGDPPKSILNKDTQKKSTSQPSEKSTNTK